MEDQVKELAPFDTGQAKSNSSDDSTSPNSTAGSQISVWKLFQYASCLDRLMIIIGVISSSIAGVSFPLIMVVIGLSITQFVDYFVAGNFLANADDTFLNITAPNISSNYSGLDYFCPLESNQGFVDYIMSDEPSQLLKDRILQLLYGMIGIGSGYLLSTFIAVTMWSISSINQEGRIRVAFIKSALSKDISYYDQHPQTELPTLLTDDIKKIGIGLGVQWDSVITQLSTIVSGFVIALYFEWKLTLATSSFIPPLLIILFLLGKFVASVTAKEQSILSSAGSLAEQILFSIKTVMAFGGQSSEWKRYDELLQTAHTQSYLKTIMTGIVFAIYNLVLFLIFAIGFWYGGKIFVECDIEVGDIIIVVFEVSVVALAFGYLVLPMTAIGIAVGSATNVYAVIDHKKSEMSLRDHLSEGSRIDHFEGNIKLENVSFAYPNRPHVQILSGIDINIKSGQTIALVGPSGCGKSTIVKLLQRIYDFTGGTIALDGHDIRQLDVSWLRSQIGVVSQEPVLFNVSVADNITFGKETATRSEVEAAAKAANAHEFICGLPNGYNTIVGEGGSQLSGGQKQRIAIARALVRDPKILLLDEATSALDTKSEKTVQESLDRARMNRTTIMIAHRLSTVQSSDLIIVIEKGNVVEMGGHNQLIKNKGLYYQLVTEQSIEESGQIQNNNGKFLKLQNSRHRFHGSRGSRAYSDGLPSYYSRTRALTLNHNTGSFFDGHHQHHYEQITEEVVGSDYIFIDESLVDEEDMKRMMNSTKPSFTQLLKLAKSDWWLITMGTISFCLIGVELSALYILMSESLQVFARRTASTVTNGLILYICLYAGLGVIGFLLHIIGTLGLGVAADRLTKRIRSRSMQCMLKQDVSFFDKQENSVSALVSMLAIDAVNINQITGIPVGFVVRVTCSAIASIVISLRASWVLSCVLLPSYLILCGAAFLQLQIGRVISNRIAGYLENGFKTAIEAIENVYTVSSLGISSIFVEKCRSQFARTTWPSKVNAILFGSLYAFSQSFIYFATAAAIYIGAIIFVTDSDSVYHSDLVDIFQSIMSVVFTSVLFNDAFHALPDIQLAKLSAQRVSRLLAKLPSIDATSNNGTILENITGQIKITDCDFCYPSRPGISILQGVDIDVKPGQSIAIVGPSGSGKSTIVSLVERFYDPTSGTITVDGVNIADLKVSWLRQQIALVSQEPVLFDMSIADNILYGSNFKEVSEDEMINAAKLANIHEFISSLPQGYNTTVGLKGTQLSGGQKQRVAIARALVRNPKILLLDEATSALDTESESVVQEALDHAKVGRTTITIAHRLSTIHNSDMIIVIQKGKVVERGTHSELMAKQGIYHAMNLVQGVSQ